MNEDKHVIILTVYSYNIFIVGTEKCHYLLPTEHMGSWKCTVTQSDEGGDSAVGKNRKGLYMMVNTFKVGKNVR